MDDALFQAAAEAGARWVTVVFAWEDIQPEPGYTYWEVPDQAVRMAQWYSLELVPRLDRPPAWAIRPDAPPGEPPVDLQAYADFAAAVAARYQSQVSAYIVWNEPNLSLEWAGQQPNPEGYVRLLRTAAEAIRGADPSALVVAAGLAPTTERSPRAMDDLAFLSAMLEAGAAAWFDALGVHPYGFGLPPTQNPDKEPLCFRRLERVHALMEAHGVEKPLWATEAGWRARNDAEEPGTAWVSPEQQADYLLAAHRLAAGAWPWLRRLGWWQLGGNDAYSLLREGAGGWAQTPALEALREHRAAGEVRKPPLEETPPEFALAAPDVVVRLGDVPTLHPHWRHLSPVPRLRWNLDFYLDFDPAGATWTLWLETMQVDQASNRIWVNGLPLDPPYLGTKGFPDISSHWVSQSFRVPPGTLRVGHNLLSIEVGPRYPAGQHAYWRWENMQVRHPRLRQAAVSGPSAGASGWQMLSSPGGWSDVQFLRRAGEALWGGAFARGGLFQSTDGGKTWLPAHQGLGTAHVFDLLAVGGALYAATDEGLFYSTDGGQNWGPHPCATGERLYSLALWGGQLYLAGESGVASCPWEPASSKADFDATPGSPLLRLLGLEENLYAAGANGVWEGQRREGRLRWTPLPTPPGDGFIQDLFALPSGTLVARNEERLWQWRGGVWTPFGPDGEGLSVASAPDGSLWLAGPGDRLQRSEDGGVTWEPAAVPATADPRHLLPLPGGALLVASQWRLWRVQEDGRWTAIDPPLGQPAVTALAREPEGSSMWIAGTVGGIYRSQDAGRTWACISPPWVVRDLAWGVQGRLYAAHDEGIAVWDGAQWLEGQGPWPEIRYFTVSPDPEQPGWAVAGSWGNNLLWTTDGGKTWEPVHQELVTLSVYSVLREPSPGQGMLLGTVEGLFHSPNGRDGWVALTPPRAGRTIFALLRDGQGTLWAGTTDGLYRSGDDAATWEPVSLGQPATILHLSAQGQVLWAGSEGHGLFGSTDGGQHWDWLGLPGVTVYDVMPTEGGWIAATSEGLWRKDGEDTRWSQTD